MQSQFLLAAPHSGAGKTTVTLGLLRALQQRGLRVQPFKCGPDYIDPIHHNTAAGCESINLDQFMMSATHIRQLYHQYTTGADVAITEGVMGLFDGARKREGSSADLARLLDLPVILVLNAKAMAYTAAALLYGLKNFDPALNIAGVIFNFVDSPIHYKLLREASDAVGITALGHLPANNALRIPSRHLGLDTAEAGEAIETAACHIEQHLDLDTILAATQLALTAGQAGVGMPCKTPCMDNSSDPKNQAKTMRSAGADVPTWPSGATTVPPSEATTNQRPAKTILVARDAAFQFLYPENLRRLEAYGNIQCFSPLQETHLPPADLLYLPGGYPECHLEQLSQNQTLLQDIQTFTTKGGKILAECGGMMVLGKSIIDESGKPWSMAGVLDIVTSIQQKKLSLGYRTLTLNGQTLKGHEFHYSHFTHTPTSTANITIHNAYGQEIPAPVFYQRNLFASYMHFYWGESLGPLENWLAG